MQATRQRTSLNCIIVNCCDGMPLFESEVQRVLPTVRRLVAAKCEVAASLGRTSSVATSCLLHKGCPVPAAKASASPVSSWKHPQVMHWRQPCRNRMITFISRQQTLVERPASAISSRISAAVHQLAQAGRTGCSRSSSTGCRLSTVAAALDRHGASVSVTGGASSHHLEAAGAGNRSLQQQHVPAARADAQWQQPLDRMTAAGETVAQQEQQRPTRPQPRRKSTRDIQGDEHLSLLQQPVGVLQPSPSLQQKAGFAAATQQAQQEQEQAPAASVPRSTSGNTLSSSSTSSGSIPATAPLTTEQSPDLSAYLNELSLEQREAVQCESQHIRVIAGPGSGKTRVVTARVASLIASGVPPEQLLVITFTRKAAGELKERLTALLGRDVVWKLQPRTFHSVCCELLREFSAFMPAKLQRFLVADEEDAEDIVRRVMQQPLLAQSSSSGGQADLLTQAVQSTVATQLVRSSRKSRDRGTSAASSSSSSSSSGSGLARDAAGSQTTPGWSEVDINVGEITRLIGLLKNFVHSLHLLHGPGQHGHRPGIQLLQDVLKAGVPEFIQLSSSELGLRKLQCLAEVYDKYTAEMTFLGMLDFDDLLHSCLSIIKNNPDVAKQLHSRWHHVLVDEGQDTNSCQFELACNLSGPNSSLFMVGDPDQAIYGFRGAKPELLCDDFERRFSAAATLFLVDNYRSTHPIVAAADRVRQQMQSKLFRAAQCMRRGSSGGDTVQLQECPSQFGEHSMMLSQLRAWHRDSYMWREMAVLCRSNFDAERAYFKALEAGLPARLLAGRQLWERPEVKVALALLRCVVRPAAAGDVIRRRLASKRSEVKHYMMEGLSDETLAKLQAHLDTLPDSSSNGSGRMSLGSCLLQDCSPTDTSQLLAGGVLQSWADTSTAAGSTDHQQELLTVLQDLAPPWQPPEGFSGIKTKKQKAAVAQLRGLVVLAQTVAFSRPPAQVLQLLLEFSGVWGNLMADACQDTDADAAGSTDSSPGPDQAGKQRAAARRLRSLRTVLSMANDTSLYTSNSDDLADTVDTSVAPGASSSSSGGQSAASTLQQLEQQQQQAQVQQSGPELLQKFYDYCALLGEQEDDPDVERDEVQFMTMHGSKGKEFRCVALLHLYEGSLPLMRATAPITQRDLEQEKNLLYVGMTRAKDQLLLTWPKEIRSKSKAGPGKAGPGKAGPDWVGREVQVSRFLRPAVLAAHNRALPGAQLIPSKY